MAPAKRKAVTDDRPNKKAKSAEGHARKSPKDESKESSERKPASKSILQQEEKAFPRGGANVLTPLEQKQIKVQAERDALFEQETGRPAEDAQADSELFDREDAASAPAKKKQKKRRRQSDEMSTRPEKSDIKIQGLGYKNLSVGSSVLGYVTAITGRDIALALANNLSGYVPITAISERLNARIETLLESEGTNGQPSDEDEDIDLKQLFRRGQWLRATVTATGSESTDSSGKSKRHIELTIDPRQVNGGLESSSVVQNSMIQASVRSVEDHGLVMDLGLSDSDVKGFVSKKELGAANKLEDIQEGQVMMCLVTGKGSNGKVLKLSPDAARFSALSGGKTAPVVSEAPSVDSFQPGIAVDVLVTESGAGGVAGKVMGMLDVMADIMHANAATTDDGFTNNYKIGSKVKGRITWAIPSDDGSRRIGVSLLNHLLTLPPPPSKLPENATSKLRSQANELEHHIPLSSILDEVRVTHVLPNRGVFLSLPKGPEESATAFAYISQISDTRIDSLASTSGPYKLGTNHKARIISYNPIDNVYYVSLKQSILDQAFLRIEDLTVGEVVKGTIERLILGAKGITGALVKLSDSISGLIPEIHLSDVHLQHPERKYKEGFPVRARVLSVDLEKRHVRLTTKKSLVTEDESMPIWKDYMDLKPGMESKGTIVNLLPAGAAVQFFGNVRAWLPVAEMSETYIEGPQKHFRLGQTVNVKILSLDAGAQEMKVSCKATEPFDSEQQEAWDRITGGQLVPGTVAGKTAESVSIELEDGLKGAIRIGHLTDGSATKADNALNKLQVGKSIAELLVLDKLERSRHIILTKKSSLIEAAKADKLIQSLNDAKAGSKVAGFVRNITFEGVYVEFTNEVVGFLPKSQVDSELHNQAEFGLLKDQSITLWVMSVDDVKERFTLSMREQKDVPATAANTQSPQGVAVTNAVDPSVTSVVDFTLGRVTRARIASIKATQLNVRLADNVQGRVDVSEVFDNWDEIANKKAPLQKFKPNEVIEVKILGIHDARNHRFLPISHRQTSVPVFELSMKRSRIAQGDEKGLTMDSVKRDSDQLAFINNYGDNCVWMNISPNVRARVALMDLSNDVGQLQNLPKHFPIGCALRTTVKAVKAAENKLDLVARGATSEQPLTLQSITKGMIVAGRITKVTEHSVVVQLSESLAAPVPLVELGDDYDQLNFDQFAKNEIVRVSVLDVDLPNKKLFLSLRPSKVLSSSLPVQDPQVTSHAQLKPGDIVRGFVKHIGEKGVAVSLGARVDALVRISDLSDQYIKDWKTIVQPDQLVKGRIISVDADAKHALLSLKASHVEDNYKPPITMSDLKSGMVVTGKVRKVEDFGAFIDIDGTKPRLSGLCHRSEVAAKRVEDVRKLYSEGDVVKAKILKVDAEARKISLGLKASYFADADDEVRDDVDEDEDDSGIDLDDDDDEVALQDDEDSEAEGGVDLGDVQDFQSDADISSDSEAMDVDNVPTTTAGLKTSGFDWTGESLDRTTNGAPSDSEPEANTPKKRKKHKPEIKVDKTGDLDKYGPRSVSDFERQLLGKPNDSGLWIQYMALQLELSEVEKAREIAERALRTIHIRDIEEKANIWIAWLNLEVEYGDDEKVEEVFRQACQVQDSLEMHEKLASIYIDSGKHDKADAIFERIVGNKAFRASPEVWLNYANFLMDTMKDASKSRTLLSRALQSIPTNEHRLLTAKFAGLEFRSSQGDAERGRTIFEGLLTEWPKWTSGWDMWIDLERSRITHATSQDGQAEAKEKVRALYHRVASQKMKKRRAKYIFKRWLEFEEEEGDEKAAEKVKAMAREYVEAQGSNRLDSMEE